MFTHTPLPERPDISHLLELQSLAGNEQLVGILNRYDELLKNIEDWSRASDLAEKRSPAYKRLLDTTDSVPDLAKAIADALRAALAQAEKRYSEIYDQESERLEAAESWQKIDQKDRDRILKGLQLAKVTKGATGTEQEVLESVECISLDAWRTRTAALPQLFVDARIQAEKLIEPKIRHVRLDSKTLRTPEEVKAWIEKTEEELLERIQHGPFVIN